MDHTPSFTQRISTKLHLSVLFLSTVAISFGVNNYLNVRNSVGLEQSANLLSSLWLQIAAIVCINIIASTLIYLTIGKPMASLLEKMTDIANGDFAETVPYTNASNDIGAIARYVKIFRENGARLQKIDEGQLGGTPAKRQEIEQLAEGFENSVKELVSQITTAATQMQSGAENVAEIAGTTKKRSAQVIDSSAEAAKRAAKLSAAAEALTNSVKEMNLQTHQSSQISALASNKAASSKQALQQLAEKATQVARLTEILNSIAGKSNLLALNATIESARAGEAGKGFTAVANEIKSLANALAKAASEFNQQIGDMQNVAKTSIDSAMDVMGIIDQVAGSSAALAAAIERQSQVSNEIVLNVARTSSGSQELSEHISSVQDEATKTDSNALQIVASASSLNVQSSALQQKTEDFLRLIRAA